MDITRIGVIGAGTMGNGIAQVFTQSGFSVQLIDAVGPALDRARGRTGKLLGAQHLGFNLFGPILCDPGLTCG